MEVLNEDEPIVMVQSPSTGADAPSTITPTPAFVFKPLPCIAWVENPEPEAMEDDTSDDGGDSDNSEKKREPKKKIPYCYLCDKAGGQTGQPNPARETILKMMHTLVREVNAQSMCEMISKAHWNTVVMKAGYRSEEERQRHLWKPETVFDHIVKHQVNETFHLITSLWALNDYDHAFRKVGVRIDTQLNTEIPPAESHMRAHLSVVKAKCDIYRQLRNGSTTNAMK